MSIAFPSLPSIPVTFFEAAYQTFDTYSSYILLNGQTLLDKGRPLFGRIYPIALPIAFVVATAVAVHFYFKQEKRLRDLETRLHKLELPSTPPFPLFAPPPAPIFESTSPVRTPVTQTERKTVSHQSPGRKPQVSHQSPGKKPQFRELLTNELLAKSKKMEANRKTIIRLSPIRQPRGDHSAQGKIFREAEKMILAKRSAHDPDQLNSSDWPDQPNQKD